MNKKLISEIIFTLVMMAAATAISFGFFYLGNKNVANIAIVYTLALILTALYTSGYLFGIIASLFCVIAVNYFFSTILRSHWESSFIFETSSVRSSSERSR